MIPVNIFPTVLIALNIVAAIVYMIAGYWRMAISFIAVVVIVACVTY